MALAKESSVQMAVEILTLSNLGLSITVALHSAYTESDVSC